MKHDIFDLKKGHTIFNTVANFGSQLFIGKSHALPQATNTKYIMGIGKVTVATPNHGVFQSYMSHLLFNDYGASKEVNILKEHRFELNSHYSNLNDMMESTGKELSRIDSLRVDKDLLSKFNAEVSKNIGGDFTSHMPVMDISTAEHIAAGSFTSEEMQIINESLEGWKVAGNKHKLNIATEGLRTDIEAVEDALMKATFMRAGMIGAGVALGVYAIEEDIRKKQYINLLGDIPLLLLSFL